MRVREDLPEGIDKGFGKEAILLSEKIGIPAGTIMRKHWTLNFNQNSQKFLAVLLCIMLVLLIGVIDYQTGYELAFSLFYLIPICLATWVSGRDVGLLVSILSACAWYVADVLSGHVYSSSLIYLWNTGIRLGFFAVVTYLLAALRLALDHERNLSRTDPLTGAANTRAFLEMIQSEINRYERYKHPFTVVYIDLDNFKTVNDRYGHMVGDKVLHTIVTEIRKRLRKTDSISRLGGDEFGLFLPETGQDAAQVVMKKIRAGIIDAMQLRKLPVTASLGVVTCEETPKSAEILIKMADDLMYTIKNHGKDGIGYSIYEG
jgi:diguanylate cyclase (GGDEF)-like protein